jgi:hypothetical protein
MSAFMKHGWILNEINGQEGAHAFAQVLFINPAPEASAHGSIRGEISDREIRIPAIFTASAVEEFEVCSLGNEAEARCGWAK